MADANDLCGAFEPVNPMKKKRPKNKTKDCFEAAIREQRTVENFFFVLISTFEPKDGEEIPVNDITWLVDSHKDILKQTCNEILLWLLRKHDFITAEAQVMVFSQKLIWNFMKFQQNQICDKYKPTFGPHTNNEVPRLELKAVTDEVADKISGIDITGEADVDPKPFFIEHNRTLAVQQSYVASSFYGCFVCSESFVKNMDFERHLKFVHGANFNYFVRREMREHCLSRPLLKVALVKNKYEPTYPSLQLKLRLGTALTIKGVKHFYGKKFVDIQSHCDKVQSEESIEIEPRVNFEQTAVAWHSVFFWLVDDSTRKEFIEHYYVKDSRFFKQKENHIRPTALEILAPPVELINVFNNGFEDTNLTSEEKKLCDEIASSYQKPPCERLDVQNYVKLLKTCVELSDCGEEFAMKEYDMVEQDLIPHELSNCTYNIEVNPNTNLPPDLSENDTIVLRASKDTCFEIQGTVKRVNANYLTIQIENPEHHHDPKACPRKCTIQPPNHIKFVREQVEGNGRLFDIRFKQLRVQVKMEKLALTIVEQQKLAKFMFPSAAPSSGSMNIRRFEWINKKIAGNSEQQQAVKYIVNGTAHPAPYIIFGPPGTGKTSTIVEAICQLCKVDTKNRILVTAQSNAACNEIADRLLTYLKKSEMYRMFSKSSAASVQKAGNDKLLKASNFASRKHVYPTWDELYEYRVVICTLCSAGNLRLAGIDPKHFTHVFIDECASATEPSSLIAIAGLVTTPDCINGKIILAGDIHQLGPVVRFNMAENLGYGQTLMERLMQLPVYKKDPETGEYNPRMITKLLQNFRSHEKILELSNKMFYEGELVAKGDPKSTKWARNWCHLPNKKFPVMFHPSYDAHCKEKTSLYNTNEVDIIAKYVKLILTFGVNGKEVRQSDIGIVSPYKRQSQRLTLRCKDYGWHDVEVGTVEAFQGREKDVVLISTVRSDTNCVGFLNNAKRLNVTLTRAKALMIIVGNPDTLRNDRHWHDLLQFCHDNGGCVTPIDVGPRPEPTMGVTNSMNDVKADFRKLFEKIKEKLEVDDFL